ncbi:MAG TPA: glycosyltransferase family 4 protein [Syntrophales bacterium]|nr:glycosyltransferase family 4 protein [Syntrophales bacterium]
MKGSLNVWLVTIGEPLPLEPHVRKHRTGIVADCLLERGHQVRWWVSAFEHQRKQMLFNEDREISLSPRYTLNVLKGCGYRRNVSLRRYLDHLMIARRFAQSSRHFDPPDAIVAAMPCYHLAYEAVRYGRQRRITVIVDVRDLWPDIFVGAISSPLMKALVRGLLIRDYRRLDYLLGRATGILAMSGGVLRWALHHARREAHAYDGVFYLGYPKVESAQGPPVWLKDHTGQKLITYVGTFGRSYELPLVVEAARRFHHSGRRDVCFVLAGTGEQEAELRHRSRDLPNVVMPGWLQSDEIAALLSRSYLGVIPCRSVIDAMPNKAFEYLAAGLPVVSSLEGEMADIITKWDIGLNYGAGDGDGLFQTISSLLDDQGRRDKMADNARDFFAEKGDAQKIYHAYAEHIERVCRTSSRVNP